MPYAAVRTFWLEPTDEVAWGLRRYSHSDEGVSTCAGGYHHSLTYLGRAPARHTDRGTRTRSVETPHSDRRWPFTCTECGVYQFTEDDAWQDWDELIWRRPETGTEYVLHDNAAPIEFGIGSAPPGASWDAYWMPSSWKRADGIYLMVRLPNGDDWAVDSEASNCTRKGEPHQCWVRHGDPRDCQVTVDKNGDTCAAGAGSILAGDYHGFLQQGLLTAG
jgi:hypothetical protein